MNSMDEYFANVTRPFNGWSDKKMATESKAIELALTGNPFFPTTQPGITDFGETVGALFPNLQKPAPAT